MASEVDPKEKPVDPKQKRLEDTCLDNAIGAGQRVRQVLVALMVFAITVTACILNGGMFKAATGDSLNWFDAKTELLERALELYQAVPKNRVVPATNVCEHAGSLVIGEYLHRSVTKANVVASEIVKDKFVLRGIESTPEQVWESCWHALHGDNLPKHVNTAVHRAAKALVDDLWSEDTVFETFHNMERTAYEQVDGVPIPLTSIRVDVNWMGLIAGMGHTALLAWLLLSVRRVNRLKELVREYDAKKLGLLIGFPYEDLGDGQPRPWTLASLSLLLGVPWGLGAAILISDCIYSTDTESLVPTLSTIVTVVDFLSCGITFLLSWWVFQSWRTAMPQGNAPVEIGPRSGEPPGADTPDGKARKPAEAATVEAE